MINALALFHMLLLAVWVNMSLPTSILIDNHYKPAAPLYNNSINHQRPYRY